MDNKTTLVVTATPKPGEMDSVQSYFKAVLPLLQGAGGKLVKRLKLQELLLGKPSGMILVMDFDSADAIVGMFESEAYAELASIREKGFSDMNILVTEEM